MTASKPDMATPVGVIKALANALRSHTYSDTERSVGESSPAYRNGWNDAMREAVRYVLGRLSLSFTCSRSCGWHAHATGDKEVARLTASYAHCPNCGGDVVMTEDAR